MTAVYELRYNYTVTGSGRQVNVTLGVFDSRVLVERKAKEIANRMLELLKLMYSSYEYVDIVLTRHTQDEYLIKLNKPVVHQERYTITIHEHKLNNMKYGVEDLI